MNLTRLTPIDGEAVLPLAEARAQVRVMHNAEDALLSALRDAAVGHVERESGVILAPAQFRWLLRSFPGRVDLPLRPVVAINSVTYLDTDGIEQEYPGARLVGGSVYPATSGHWPCAYHYAAVTFTAGLDAPTDAPELIAAAKLMIGHLWENRSASSERAMAELPLGVDALIGTYRLVSL
jgi:uncharacterized phiE125 gp8 family phage protein